MSTIEAYARLKQILENVNAIVGQLFASNVMEKAQESNGSSKDGVFNWSSGLEDVDDENIYFGPEKGNVIFASAIDTWGFRFLFFVLLESPFQNIYSQITLSFASSFFI